MSAAHKQQQQQQQPAHMPEVSGSSDCNISALSSSSEKGSSFEASIDSFASYWHNIVAKDKRRYAARMERIRKEQEAPPKPPLYMTEEQKKLHRLVFDYVEGLQEHEEQVERQKAIHDTRQLLQTVTLMER